MSNKTTIRTSRTKMLNILANSGGKFVTTTHVGKDGELHIINGMRLKEQNHPMGYVKMYAPNKGERLLNPQTFKTLVCEGTKYRAR